tara:strand:- start:101 stop:769 length:669 start_codon:yes stop_codon:yes gene_type:complete
MGVTLTGKTIKDTYQGIVKLSDNAPITAGYKTVTDGFGNDTGLLLSNSGVKALKLYSDMTTLEIDADTGFICPTTDWVKTWIKNNSESPVSSIREVQVVVSPTQLKDLVANPKEIVPAAGAGKVIKLIAITGFLNYGTVAFDFVSVLDFQYETSGIVINQGTYADWNQTTDYYFDIDKTASSGGPLSANEGIVLTTATDATVGDGYITIVALYSEQNFNITP